MQLSFLRSRKGGVALISALAVSVLVLAAGGVADYSRAMTARRAMQSAADAAVLAVTRALPETDAEAQRLAEEIVSHSLDLDAFTAPPRIIGARLGPGEFRVSVEAPSRSYFLGLIGKDGISIKAQAAAALATAPIEVAFVFDVSGSMRNDRIQGAKTAAIAMIDKAESNGANASFALVPFTMSVNIGPGMGAFVDDAANPLFAGTAWSGCVLARPAPHDVSNAYSGLSGPDGKWRAYIWPPEPNDGASACNNVSDGTNDGYAFISEGGDMYSDNGPNFNCVQHAVTPLTSNAPAIRAAIQALTTPNNEGTILAPGVTWGWRALTPELPYDEAAARGAGRKILVMLTDGDQVTDLNSGTCDANTNTVTPYAYDPGLYGLAGTALSSGPYDSFTPWGYIGDSDPFGTSPGRNAANINADLDTLTRRACAAVAADPSIEVYAVSYTAAAGPGTRVYDVMADCVSKPENLYSADDGTELTAVFDEILKASLILRMSQ